jgi:KUP system potassium uptake protein
VLHKRVVVLPLATGQVPHVPDEERLSIQPLGARRVQRPVRVHGRPERPRALEQAREQGLELDAEDVTYFLGRETIIVTAPGGDSNLAGEAVRADGAQRGPRHGLVPATT